ncbi:iron-containing alcohol dehydrogenase [Granulicella sp. WH15]|uniref:iron-containing alcohol dehydrogenase n=1 Tax=Granulicella sp. WH15 TaxID=2602070 RepID=UPI0013673290|nr:iron-containing alcohol dehydrogenase [Granulicella sp. WH15]QHN04813.1 iron-containing alcohol dehydrogenase [Granulicella sp. WH15]
MRTITFLQPDRLTFGSGCIVDCLSYLAALPTRNIHIVTSPSFHAKAEALATQLEGCTVTIDSTIGSEPTVAMFHAAVARARAAKTECVLGIGGGSALDTAKLVAAFVNNEQTVEETFGIGLLGSRRCHLVCVPTTSGTGSEVSPNAILLDEAAQLKKGVISPYLVPDATFIDPALTVSMPAAVTASTGLDALTHCIEAYTNNFAHPLVDLYALEGIRLTSRYIVRAVNQPDDLEAREGMSRASLYGGLCLGPVNTAAVHALAYPLGGEFHLAHGLSNAILLPPVFAFNSLATPTRHAEVALALGVEAGQTDRETAAAGVEKLRQLARECGVVADLAKHGLDRSAIPRMAMAAMTVTRLLRNNPRELTQADAEELYGQCFES